MVSRLPSNASASELNAQPEPVPVVISVQSKGQTLRVFGFQVIAFLLGVALAFM